MKAIIIEKQGGLDQINLVEVPLPEVKPDEILIKLTFAGINFVDIYERMGVYPIVLPFIPGKEGVGTIISKGERVKEFSVGERVGFAYVTGGSYSEYIAINAEHAVALPPEIDDVTAVSCLLQGLTSYFLTHDTFPLQPGHTALIHAAAGGVGLLTVQMAKLLGAKVIGTVSTAQKLKLAEEAGADYVIRYDEKDFVKGVMHWTEGVGVDVVYDSVGASTFTRSFEVLKNRGTLVFFGQSSGVLPPIDLNSRLGNRTQQRGSFYITRPVIRHYIDSPEALKSKTNKLFNYIIQRKIRILVGNQYTLENCRQAHQDLENRLTIGKSILKII
jgi:NADPH:quinone reductase